MGWPPDDEYPAVAQSGWPYEDEYLEEARSPRVELVDAVARLQKELFGYGSARRPASSSQTTRGLGFTSTSVPRYMGRSSWDQYRQVFEAIVCSNGWDGVTAALQLVSHLEGDDLNVALLLPESQRVLPGVLVGALSEHYGSPGRLAEYKRQFERALSTRHVFHFIQSIRNNLLCVIRIIPISTVIHRQTVKSSILIFYVHVCIPSPQSLRTELIHEISASVILICPTNRFRNTSRRIASSKSRPESPVS